MTHFDSWRARARPSGLAHSPHLRCTLLLLPCFALPCYLHSDGAKSFLFTEYSRLAGFVVFVFICVTFVLMTDGYMLRGLYTAINIVVGATMSASAGYLGMWIATEANSRTTLSCVESMTAGLRVSFASGAVMANAVVGLGILGLTVMFLIFDNVSETWNVLAGFSAGASCIALFARVGGGVFTKAADVGADLVGKVEQGIPEDDPRNPAVIADNIGDNVGDVAGMGADLFESFVGSIVATASLAPVAVPLLAPDVPSASLIALPLWVAGVGVILSLVGVAVVRASKLDTSASLQDLLWVLRKGIFVAMILSALGSLLVCLLLFDVADAFKLWLCLLVGLVSGELIGMFTEYCTSYEDAPTRDIAAASEFGAAPVIIKGLGVGMISVVVPTMLMAFVIVCCYEIGSSLSFATTFVAADLGLYSVALAGVGLLSTLGITLATDAYGPVADNAGGIAEMAGLPSEVRDRTDALDSLGNTTAATGKGFAIGSAVLTSIGLISAFVKQAGLTVQDTALNNAYVLVGTLLGAMLPFLFAALTMLSVDRSARAIITEVRLQFAQCPQLMMREGQTEEEYAAEFEARQVNDLSSPHDGKIKGDDGNFYPDNNRCVAIATESAIQEMLLPGTIAVFSPVVLGLLLGPGALAGMLVGSLGSGFMLALTMANAGGAWDNAKKWVEKCASEGEPMGETLTYTTYGVKKEGVAQSVLEEGNTAQLLAEGEGEEDLEAVTARLVTLYKDRHDPVVVGDTVGDPFKDTSGPALNILIKLMSVVSLVLAPMLRGKSHFDDYWWTSLIVLVVVGGVCWFLMKRFDVSNTKRSEEAIAAKKAADARYAGAVAPAAGGDADADAVDVEGGLDKAPEAAAEEEQETAAADAAE